MFLTIGIIVDLLCLCFIEKPGFYSFRPVLLNFFGDTELENLYSRLPPEVNLLELGVLSGLVALMFKSLLLDPRSDLSL